MQTNLQYLHVGLTEAGFPAVEYNHLQEKIMEGHARIVIPYSHTPDKKVYVHLHVVKWNDCPFYYFSKFNLSIPGKLGNAMVSRDFYFGSKKDPALYFSEAYSLLNGKPIYKKRLFDRAKLVHFNSWLQLDFNTTDGNGNFKIRYFKNKIQLNEENDLPAIMGNSRLYGQQTNNKSENVDFWY